VVSERGRGALPTDATWVRPGPTARERRDDVLGGLGLAALAQVSAELARSTGATLGGPAPSTAEQTAWLLALTLPLCVRRRAPLLVLGCVAVLYIGLQVRYVPEGTMTSVALFTALYTAGAWGRDRRAAVATRVVVVVAMFCWLGIALSTTAWREASVDTGPRTGLLPPATASYAYGVLLNALYFGAAWLFGDAAWRAARQRAALQETARALRATRAESEQRAVLEERVRIARELHDVVAHHVSVMGVQAGAARRVLDRDPERARSTLGLIEASSRSAVAEMRRLLGVLRSDEGVEPAPGLDRLPALVEEAAAALEVELAVVGEPRAVPPSVAVSAYRVVQEALTNVVKHAAARHAVVRVRWLDDALEVEVVDDGRRRARTRDTRAEGSGLGLVGMRERVGLHDGELDLGPRPEGGWRVRARFPLPAAAEAA
jgi:signal transduction histidine kinase